jgi:hypothetical protein
MTHTARQFWFAVHNLVAHPLLVLWPRAGERLHDWTADRMG